MDRGREELPDALCQISIITLYEFIRGKADPTLAKGLLEEIFDVVPLDNRVVSTATEIWRELRGLDVSLDDRDLLIGATAIANGVPLLTRNVRHYDRLRRYGLKFWREEEPETA